MAVFEIQGPDGQIFEIEAPDEQSAINAYKDQTAGGTIGDLMRSGASGLARGATALMDLPSNAAGMALQGGMWLGEKAGLVDPEFRQETNEMFDFFREGSGATGLAERVAPRVMNYQPNTMPGEFAQTTGEFVPGAVLGGGPGLMARAGLVSEAAGQMTEGTAAEPYARVAGALVGGARMPPKAPSVPTSEELIRLGGQQIDDAVRTGMPVPPAATAAMANTATSNLAQKGLIKPSGKIQKGYAAARDAKSTLDEYANIPMTPEQAQSVRRQLGDVAGTGGTEGLIGKQLQTEFDKSITSQYLPKLADANKTYARGKRGEIVDLLIDRADRQASRSGTGGNTVNAIRQRADALLRQIEDGTVNGFSEAEVKALRDIVKGSNATNVLRAGGFLAPSTGKLQALLGGGALAGTAAVPGAMPFVLGGMAASEGSKMLAELMTRNQINNLSRTVRSGGPLPKTPMISDAQKEALSAIAAALIARTGQEQ